MACYLGRQSLKKLYLELFRQCGVFDMRDSLRCAIFLGLVYPAYAYAYGRMHMNSHILVSAHTTEQACWRIPILMPVTPANYHSAEGSIRWLLSISLHVATTLMTCGKSSLHNLWPSELNRTCPAVYVVWPAAGVCCSCWQNWSGRSVMKLAGYAVKQIGWTWLDSS